MNDEGDREVTRRRVSDDGAGSRWWRASWQDGAVSRMFSPGVRLLPLAVALLTGSCAELGNLSDLADLAAPAGELGLTPPTVTLAGTTLARAPSQQQLAAYYCPELV